MSAPILARLDVSRFELVLADASTVFLFHAEAAVLPKRDLGR